MNKSVFLICSLLFIHSFAQKYDDKDFLGYINYIQISSVNVRFNPLLFEGILDREQDWYAKNKIKKITYLFNEKFSQSTSYAQDGSIAESSFNSGSKNIISKNKNEVRTVEYNNGKENFVSVKKMSSDGKLLSMKNQYTSSKKDSTVTRFYYENAKIVNKEQLFNNKLQRKSEFKYDKNLLTKLVGTDYVMQVQPNQTHEAENVNYKYDDAGNCILIERSHYFGVLKNRHIFTYNNQNKLIKEVYTLDQGEGSKTNEGTIEYDYNANNKIIKIIEKNQQKNSHTEVLYSKNDKVDTVTITCESCYSTYFPINFYPGKMTNVYNFKYDDRGNLTEIINTVNGELKSRTQYLIEYY